MDLRGRSRCRRSRCHGGGWSRMGRVRPVSSAICLQRQHRRHQAGKGRCDHEFFQHASLLELSGNARTPPRDEITLWELSDVPVGILREPVPCAAAPKLTAAHAAAIRRQTGPLTPICSQVSPYIPCAHGWTGSANISLSLSRVSYRPGGSVCAGWRACSDGSGPALSPMLIRCRDHNNSRRRAERNHD